MFALFLMHSYIHYIFATHLKQILDYLNIVFALSFGWWYRESGLAIQTLFLFLLIVIFLNG